MKFDFADLDQIVAFAMITGGRMAVPAVMGCTAIERRGKSPHSCILPKEIKFDFADPDRIVAFEMVVSELTSWLTLKDSGPVDSVRWI